MATVIRLTRMGRKNNLSTVSQLPTAVSVVMVVGLNLSVTITQ